MIWTAIMLISLNGQPHEVRGAQSLDERACQAAAYRMVAERRHAAAGAEGAGYPLRTYRLASASGVSKAIYRMGGSR